VGKKASHSLQVIDAHSHLAIQGWFSQLKKDYHSEAPRIVKEGSASLYSLSAGGDASTTMHVPAMISDVVKRLRWLDKVKIDLELIAPVPSFMFLRYPFEIALELSKAQNDGIAEVVKDHPERFAGICSVPVQNPARSLAELERAVSRLGMKGVEIGTNINGTNLDDRSLWPFYNKVQELGVPIMVHPFNVAAGDRLRRYYLSNLIGNPLDTSIAIASVILGGVLDEFPKISFFFVHGAGFIPYQRGRLDHGFAVRPEAKEIISRRPSSYLHRVFADTIVHFYPALSYLIETMGPSQILLGSDAPFDMGPKDPVRPLLEINLNALDRTRTCSENAKRLFRLKA
jgi:aminocarboxymuconate-semialdehyde decarboxylase